MAEPAEPERWITVGAAAGMAAMHGAVVVAGAPLARSLAAERIGSLDPYLTSLPALGIPAITGAALAWLVGRRARSVGGGAWYAIAGWTVGAWVAGAAGGELTMSVVERLVGAGTGTLDVGVAVLAFTALDPKARAAGSLPLAVRCLVAYGAVHLAVWGSIAAAIAVSARGFLPPSLAGVAMVPVMSLAVTTAGALASAAGPLEPGRQRATAGFAGAAFVLALPDPTRLAHLSGSELPLVALPFTTVAVALGAVWVRARRNAGRSP